MFPAPSSVISSLCQSLPNPDKAVVVLSNVVRAHAPIFRSRLIVTVPHALTKYTMYPRLSRLLL